MKRPSPFQLLDFLTFGVISLIGTALAAYVQSTPQTFQAYALTWVVAGMFWAIYAILIRLRAKFIAKYPIMLKSGTMVNPGEYKISTESLDNEVDRIVALYFTLVPKAGVLLSDSRVWITFRPGPFDHPQGYSVKVAGFVTAGGEGCEVGYTSTDQPVEQTAFGHELGHIILGRYWNDWDQERHHNYMKEHGLP